jgi:quercetin dioxygenase-like cupin family protein
VGVEGRVVFSGHSLHVVMLRFARDATVDEHAAPHHIDVVCLQGSGVVSTGTERASFDAGNSVRWPAGVPHRLWTEDTEMTTLMLEHVGRGSGL